MRKFIINCYIDCDLLGNKPSKRERSNKDDIVETTDNLDIKQQIELVDEKIKECDKNIKELQTPLINKEERLKIDALIKDIERLKEERKLFEKQYIEDILIPTELSKIEKIKDEFIASNNDYFTFKRRYEVLVISLKKYVGSSYIFKSWEDLVFSSKEDYEDYKNKMLLIDKEVEKWINDIRSQSFNIDDWTVFRKKYI